MSITKNLITVGMSFGIALIANAANAMLTCNDVSYGNKNYHENMEQLAIEARLPGNYFNRYHETIISELCKGKTDVAESWIDYGYVKRSEVEGIKETLGLNKQSALGSSYQYSSIKFRYEMGLSSAFSDNVAQYYTKRPASKCGQLAKSAIEGNPRAIKTLQSYPKYCIWNYK